MNNNMAVLRERWNDPLLTALTALLAVMLFVIAPLQASGVFVFQAFEFVLAIVLVAGVFVMSGNRTAFAAMLVSLVMATIGAISRLKAPSVLDINLFAGAWLIMGITLGWVVSREVFAPGRVTHHRVMGPSCSISRSPSPLRHCLHLLDRSYPRHFPDCRWKIVRRLPAT